MNRHISGRNLNPIGLGCMNLSHAYGVPPSPEDGTALLHKALDLGIDHFDTAALYGFGANEALIGHALKGRRHQVFLASKCGMTGIDGKRVLDRRPQTLKATCEAALTRLHTEVIDLYYLHRRDKAVPIEESVGALSDLVRAGKIRAIGLSEVSKDTLLRAHAVHPVAAVQSEYSLWSRNVEIAVLEACKSIGAAFVAFSPVARGFLAGGVRVPQFIPGDIRGPMPRFQTPNFEANFALFEAFSALSRTVDLTPAQLALQWVLAQGDHVHVIPGTTSVAHLEENMASLDRRVDISVLDRAGDILNQMTVRGPRYPAAVQAEIDTEEFA